MQPFLDNALSRTVWLVCNPMSLQNTESVWWHQQMQSAMHSDVTNIVPNVNAITLITWKVVKRIWTIWNHMTWSSNRFYNNSMFSLLYALCYNRYSWAGTVKIGAQALVMALNGIPLSTLASWTVPFSLKSQVVAGKQLKRHGSGCQPSDPKSCTSHSLSHNWSDEL